VRLEALLRNGHWGALRLGITRQGLAGQLGPPESWDATDTERDAQARGVPVAGWALSQVLKFGLIEFHFPEDLAGRCIRIFCDDFEALGQPQTGSLRVDPWGMPEGATQPAIAARLQGEGMAPTVEPFPWDPQQSRLLLPSGAALGFTTDPSYFAPGTTQGAGRLFCFVVEDPSATP
jgi:hypothetical protein